MIVQMGEWMGGWLTAWMGGWMTVQMDEWICGWIAVQIIIRGVKE